MGYCDKIADRSRLGIFRQQNKYCSSDRVCDRLKTFVGKRENSGNQHFLVFPQCFQKPYPVKGFPFSLSANAFKFGKTRILTSGVGITLAGEYNSRCATISTIILSFRDELSNTCSD